MNKFYIFCRYQYHSKNNNIEFCNWFKTDGSFLKEEDAKNRLSELKETTKGIDKSTKLKHEYVIREIDEEIIPQPSLAKPRGRKKKIEESIIKKIIKDLKKKERTKIDESLKQHIYHNDEIREILKKEFPDKFIRYWYNDKEELLIILKSQDYYEIIQNSSI